jgi:hypothetical protein
MLRWACVPSSRRRFITSTTHVPFWSEGFSLITLLLPDEALDGSSLTLTLLDFPLRVPRLRLRGRGACVTCIPPGFLRTAGVAGVNDPVTWGQRDGIRWDSRFATVHSGRGDTSSTQLATSHEARITGFALARLHAAEERFERQIDTQLNILQDLAMHQLERTPLGFPIRKQGLRFIQPKRLLAVSPGISPRGKGLVVDPATLLKLLLKETLLASAQMQAVLICGFTQPGHIPILAYNRIERKCYSCLPVGYIGFSATAFIPGLKARGFLPPFL